MTFYKRTTFGDALAKVTQFESLEAARKPDLNRYSNIDYEDCGECSCRTGSGICSNCEADGGYCPECASTGNCSECQGSGRRPIEVDHEYVAEVHDAGIFNLRRSAFDSADT